MANRMWSRLHRRLEYTASSSTLFVRLYTRYSVSEGVQEKRPGCALNTLFHGGTRGRVCRNYPTPYATLSISLFPALAENIAMLEQVERSALNGSLAESLGKDVIGWHVTNQQQTDRAARIKRAPYYGWRYTATVEPYRVAPTKTSKVTKTDAADAGVGPGQRIVPRCRCR